jgi:hypothetical protein
MRSGYIETVFQDLQGRLFRSIPLVVTAAAFQAGVIYGIWFYSKSYKFHLHCPDPVFICVICLFFTVLGSDVCFVMMSVADIGFFK